MVALRRSSTRSREGHSSPLKASTTPSRLPTLAERDPTPKDNAQSGTDPVMVPTPSKKNVKAMPDTPSSTKGIQLDPGEMHPSLHQSTAKKLASEQRFGFSALSTTSTPTKQVVLPTEPKTVPAKQNSENPFTSPSFEFRFNRPSSELSTEARRMMDEVREQAALIKVQLEAQRDEQTRKDGEADGLWGSRKIANPKGKIGRFSDVHLEQFKTMDSIANHPSSFRADLSRPSSAKKSLKRTNSKAELDKPDSKPSSPLKVGANQDRDDKDQSPVKRMKKLDGSSKVPTPMSQRGPDTPSRLPSSKSSTSLAVTPTKGASARVMSSRSAASNVPRAQVALDTPTKPRLFPSVPQTDPSNKRRSIINSKISSVKSILRKPQIRFSNDPLKQAAGTHLPPKTQSPLKDSMPVNATPSNHLEKQVSFSPTPQILGKSRGKEPGSPSPLKKAIVYPELGNPKTSSTFPATGVTASPTKTIAPPGGPRDFTFRAGTTINFADVAQIPSTPTPKKTAGVVQRATFGQDSAQMTGMPSVPHGLSNKKRKRGFTEDESEDKENQNRDLTQGHEPKPSPSKRVKKEQNETTQGPSKRVKTTASSEMNVPGVVRADKNNTKKKSVLSFSRLQQLAKPKQRK